MLFHIQSLLALKTSNVNISHLFPSAQSFFHKGLTFHNLLKRINSHAELESGGYPLLLDNVDCPSNLHAEWGILVDPHFLIMMYKCIYLLLFSLTHYSGFANGSFCLSLANFIEV